MPAPAVPELPSKLESTAVFWRGQTAADGTVYPCVRIPSISECSSLPTVPTGVPLGPSVCVDLQLWGKCLARTV